MRYVPAEMRRFLVERAGGRCEYCGLPQQGQGATFHVDHVIPVSAGGETMDDNLALACVSCSLRKAARQRAVDPQTGKEVNLFNPRRDAWRDHFRWQGVHLVGFTETGRATLEALNMNRGLILAVREEEIALGRHTFPETG